MRYRCLAVAGISIALLAGACSSSTKSSSTNTTGGAAVADSKLDPNAIFKFAWVAPTSMDPHKSSIASDLYVLYPVYDRLIHQSPEVKPIPGLATSWSFSPDGKALTLKLRPNVTFQDGTPFNAAAVKANLERAMTLPASAVKTDLATVDTVQATDDMTVTINLKTPNASLPLTLSQQAGMMISPAALNNPDLDRKPVGAGMFSVSDYQPGQKITYTKYANYWDKSAVKVAGMVALLTNDFTARFNMLRDGQLDASRLDPVQASQAAGAGLLVLPQDSIEIGMLSLNRAKPPLDNVKVRQALNYGIDRNAIIQGVLFGLGTPDVQVYPKGNIAYNPSVSVDQYKYDPAKAKQLLQEAGVGSGFDMEVNVAALDFTVSYAEAIQAQLKKIGVNVKINKVDLASYGAVVYTQAHGDGTAVIGAARADPSATALQFQPKAFTNPGGASTPEVQALYTKSLDSGLSDADRAKVLQDLSKTLVDQAMAVVLFHPKNVWATSKKVVGLQMYQNVIEFRGMGILK